MHLNQMHNHHPLQSPLLVEVDLPHLPLQSLLHFPPIENFKQKMKKIKSKLYAKKIQEHYNEYSVC